MKFLVSCITFLVSLTLASSVRDSYTGVPYYPVEAIPTVLAENGLTTLVDLIKRAGLADTASGPGPFTVFAPTNEAFAAVDPKIINYLLSNNTLLRAVLSYHIVGSEILPSALKNELLLPTIEGEKVRVNVYGKNGEVVTINGALVLKTLKASNGIIYVIDTKLFLNKPNTNIIRVLENNKAFTTLLTALRAAGLTSTLESKGPFTLFAPTNAAFRALPMGALDKLLANPEELKKVLLTHVVSGTVYSRGLSSGAVPVLSGGTVEVEVSPKAVRIGNARVIDTNLSGTNGVVHVIDAVILQRKIEQQYQ